jgi:hypothetical protein
MYAQSGIRRGPTSVHQHMRMWCLMREKRAGVAPL